VNPKQLAEQIRYLLRAIQWPGGGVVFGPRGVIGASEIPSDEAHPPESPFAWVLIGDAESDEDHPELQRQTIRIITATLVAGDPHGERAILGGPITGPGAGENRGITEVMERVRAAVGQLTGADGVPLVVSSQGIGGPRLVARARHLAYAECTLVAWCTSEPFYAAPQELALTGTDGWSWEGSHCSARYDFLGYRLVERLGSSPSTDPTDGTVVYQDTDPEATHTAQVGRFYTVFADYGDRGAIVGSSSPEVGSYWEVE